jgi:hypothetical protein
MKIKPTEFGRRFWRWNQMSWSSRQIVCIKSMIVWIYWDWSSQTGTAEQYKTIHHFEVSTNVLPFTVMHLHCWSPSGCPGAWRIQSLDVSKGLRQMMSSWIWLRSTHPEVKDIRGQLNCPKDDINITKSGCWNQRLKMSQNRRPQMTPKLIKNCNSHRGCWGVANVIV